METVVETAAAPKPAATPAIPADAVHELYRVRTQIRALQDREAELRDDILSAVAYRAGIVAVPGFGQFEVERRLRSQLDVRALRAAHPALCRKFSQAVPFHMLRLIPQETTR